MFEEASSEAHHWRLYDHPTGGSLSWGSHAAAKHARKLGYDLLVLTADNGQDADGSIAATGIEIYYWPSIDDAFMVTLPGFRKVIEDRGRSLARHVETGRQVLVTCAEGYNRSALLAARAFYELTGWPGEAVIMAVRAKRPQALFNDGFRNWIAEWKAREGMSNGVR